MLQRIVLPDDVYARVRERVVRLEIDYGSRSFIRGLDQTDLNLVGRQREADTGHGLSAPEDAPPPHAKSPHVHGAGRLARRWLGSCEMHGVYAIL